MPAVYQEMADNLLGIHKIWYTSGIHLFIPVVCQLDKLFVESLTFTLQKNLIFSFELKEAYLK